MFQIKTIVYPIRVFKQAKRNDMNNTIEENVDLSQLSKENILAGLRGMWQLWCGGNLEQISLSDLHKLVAKKLYQDAASF